MGDANCPECGGGYTCDEWVCDYTCDEWVCDGEVVTATCRDCQTEFDVEASVSFNMA